MTQNHLRTLGMSPYTLAYLGKIKGIMYAPDDIDIVPYIMCTLWGMPL